MFPKGIWNYNVVFSPLFGNELAKWIDIQPQQRNMSIILEVYCTVKKWKIQGDRKKNTARKPPRGNHLKIIRKEVALLVLSFDKIFTKFIILCKYFYNGVFPINLKVRHTHCEAMNTRHDSISFQILTTPAVTFTTSWQNKTVSWNVLLVVLLFIAFWKHYFSIQTHFSILMVPL